MDSNSMKALKKSLKGIASFLTEMKKGKDDEEFNTLDFALRGILSGIHWKAGAMLKKSQEETQPDAKQQLERAIREHKGDELSEVNVNRRADYLERIQYQEAHLAAIRDAVAEIWSEVTDKPMNLPGSGAADAPVRQTNATARAAVLLGKHIAPSGQYNSTIAAANGAAN